MKKDEIITRHQQFKNKTMQELIDERHKNELKRQNELRKKYLPEKYNPNI